VQGNGKICDVGFTSCFLASSIKVLERMEPSKWTCKSVLGIALKKSSGNQDMN